jgi:hypothetical protein
MQGRYWACYCLRYLIMTGKTLPDNDVLEAIYNCFKLKIEYKKGSKSTDGWQASSNLPIIGAEEK